ncbi:zinc-binding metallopeptidase family protein [Kosmotoga arenicorallina]|nr:hypothetical protein [Kosmotoga arenicorallina]
MQEYVERSLKELGIPYDKDYMGNIYRLIPNTPLLSAHMDALTEDYEIGKLSNIKESYGIIKGEGNIGADDKLGVYMLLELLKEYKCSFVFSVQEESGREGIQYFLSEKAKEVAECNWGLVLDRRGKEHFIGSLNSYCTVEFSEAVSEVTGFKEEHGSLSDADYLSNYISCVNLSIGYQNPHSKDEYIILKDAENSYIAARKMCSALYQEKFKNPEK